MADEVPKTDGSKSTGPFDVRTVKSLVALMAEHDLAEIDLRDGTQRLRLRRGQQGPIMVSASQMPLAAPPPLPAAAASTAGHARPSRRRPVPRRRRSSSRSRAPRSAPFTALPIPTRRRSSASAAR